MKKTLGMILGLTGIFCNQFSYGQICFNVQTSFAVEPSQTKQMCSGDFNQDGKSDLAIANIDGTVSIALGNGNGGFNSVWVDSADTYIQSICSADFNLDGKADLAVYNSGIGQISILTGNGTGQFTTTASYFTGYYNANNTLCADDFNSDGKIDLAFSTSFNMLGVLNGFGNGAFGQVQTISTSFSCYGQIGSADVNQDTHADLICKNGLLLGNGSGGFTSSATFQTADNPMSVAWGDYNGDDTLDVITANCQAGNNSNVAFYQGNGVGGFATPVYFTLGDSTFIPNNGFNFICSGDFNQDNVLDIALGTYDGSSAHWGSRVALLVNNGSGVFSTPFYFAVPDFVKAIVPHDLNGDGKIDLSVLSRNTTDSSQLTVMLNCLNSTGIDHTEQNNMLLYPNPGTGEIHITGYTGSHELRVFDIFGNTVLQTKTTLPETMLRLPSRGIYLIQLQQSDGSTVHAKLLYE